MQPTTPFNAEGRLVRIAEGIGWILLAAFWYRDGWAGLSLSLHIALGMVWTGYVFIRLCSLIHWHRGARRGEGLEQHFGQMCVIAIYGWGITNGVAAIHFPVFLIYPIAAIFVAVSAINTTLLYIYSKDRSTVPVNFYSHHKTGEEDV